MLSYQHSYHAGNFADVFKHLVLSRLINYLIAKDKPLFYLDTHSGRGIYDLKSPQALKTHEAVDGIMRLWAEHQQLPDVFQPYINAIKRINTQDELCHYPGSPALAIDMLRAQDRLCFNELHPREFEYLNQLPKDGKRVSYLETDGIKDMKAFLPPAEKRGLIFIDPSFEIKTEYRDIPRALKIAYDRFQTGVYCLWYPVVDVQYHQQLLRGMRHIGAEKNLRAEFHLTASGNTGMTGCGLWIINPPYVLEAELKIALKVLCKIYNPGLSSYITDNLNSSL